MSVDAIIYLVETHKLKTKKAAYSYSVQTKDGTSILNVAEAIPDATGYKLILLALVEALQSVGDQAKEISLCTTSKLLVNTLTKGWIDRWLRTGFRTVEGYPVKYKEYYLQLLPLLQLHKLHVYHVARRGHPLIDQCTVEAYKALSDI